MDDVFKQSWHAKCEKFRPLGNRVNDYGILGVISLVERGLQSKITKHGTIFKLELRWNGVRE